MVAAYVFYILDHIVRAVKTRVTTAKLRPLPELGTTRVEVPSINAGWRAGQHVRLRVLSSSIGWWDWSEVHPFTIAMWQKRQKEWFLCARRLTAGQAVSSV
jgi:hypothetical protein